MAPICTTAPSASGVVFVPWSGASAGLRVPLRFNLEGRPRGRAAPANLHADPQAEVWGVLYAITRRDLVRLDATEGVPYWHYRQKWLEAEDIIGNRLGVVTYIAHGSDVDGNPSLRYLTLLREGARTHGLPGHYVRFLESVGHAD